MSSSIEFTTYLIICLPRKEYPHNSPHRALITPGQIIILLFQDPRCATLFIYFLPRNFLYRFFMLINFVSAFPSSFTLTRYLHTCNSTLFLARKQYHRRNLTVNSLPLNSLLLFINYYLVTTMVSIKLHLHLVYTFIYI